MSVPPPETVDDYWSAVGSVTSISRARQGGGCRDTGSGISGEVRVRAHVYGQESRALLARVAKDLIFNYWLGHLGDQSDGITLGD